ncbi:MAG: EF-P beta-lysylation protein EpmB [Gammaproteobacteria bacterium]|nr:MAG: EF-P beta-lysylation protein EpmB [Gammaproteobacteria bacterium]
MTQADWKSELSESICSVEALLELVQLDKTQLSGCQQAAADFPLRVPRAFLSRMEPGNPADPLLMQVLPLESELTPSAGFIPDPLDEAAHNPVPGLVHKYRNRVLLIVSPTCAVNCRYCFRRHFPYGENRQNRQQWRRALAYIENDLNINEVIYSGGDPLAANDQFLSWLTKSIAAISHVKRLRVHTRMPVVIPSRIDSQLLGWMAATRLKPIVVLHINHGNEIDGRVKRAVRQLLDSGLTVLNQTVLLNGVNDNAGVLVELSEALYESGVMPYYLHLLDPVQGAGHFQVSDRRALQIYRDMQAALPGYLVPKLVREHAGASSKTILAP